MRKYLLLLILLFTLTGCQSRFLGSGITKEWEKAGNEKLKLKAGKDKILKSEIIKEYQYKKVEKLLGEAATTTASTSAEVDFYEVIEIPTSPTSTVEYTYISDILATATPYFANGENFSRAEYLKKDKNIIAFYEEEKWVIDNNKIVDILKATTTLDAFNQQIAKSKIDIVLSSFAWPVMATTSYTATGTTSYNPGESGTVSVVVVGGGGGGGTSIGGGAGGGGGGGFSASSSYPVTAQSYTITVGDGGLGGANSGNGNRGASGGTSTFGTINVPGGGGGGAWTDFTGANGASGGGGSYSLAAGNGTSPYGNNGGAAMTSGNVCGGGGGGYGSVGETASGGTCSSTASPKGGDGATSTITGVAVCYAGGGGGGNGNTPGASLNSPCGGGKGGIYDVSTGNAAGFSGTANTGGGGGGTGQGAFQGTPRSTGGKGGSGVVILQFTPSATSSPQTILLPNIINFE